MERNFTEEDIMMSINTSCSTPSHLVEMLKWKPLRMAQGAEKPDLTQCSWERKGVQLLWNTVGLCLKKLNIHFPWDSAHTAGHSIPAKRGLCPHKSVHTHVHSSSACNSPKLEAAWMFFSRWKVKPTQASPHLRTLLSCEKEGTSDTATPGRVSRAFCQVKKERISQGYILSDSIHITFSKRWNYGDGGQISALWGGNRGREGKGREVMWLEVVTQRSVVVMGQVASWLWWRVHKSTHTIKLHVTVDIQRDTCKIVETK